MNSIRSKLAPVIFLLILSSLFFVKARYPALGFGPKKNMILFTIDCLRPDHLGCYGYQRKTSPVIDALAKKGILFNKAISVSSWTGESISAIATSNYSRIFGNFEDWGNNKDISFMPTLQERLKEKSYVTAFMTSHKQIRLIRGFEDNFDMFITTDGSDQEINVNAIDWLSKNREKPFFLWIHYTAPHSLNPVPSPFFDKLFINDSIHKDKYVYIDTSLSKILSKILEVSPSKEKTNIDNFISLYDRQIAFNDNLLGMLLEDVKRLGLDKNTIFIISADHGQYLGDHGYLTHENGLYDSVIKVPLIIIGNGVIPENKVINDQVSMIDLAPTILHIAGIKKPKQMLGNSFFPLIRGSKRNSAYYAFSERDCGRIKAIRGEDWKLIDNSLERYELYNLKDDPNELENKARAETQVFEELKRELDAWTQQTWVKLPEVERRQLDEKNQEELRSLGYLQ